MILLQEERTTYYDAADCSEKLTTRYESGDTTRHDIQAFPARPRRQNCMVALARSVSSFQFREGYLVGSGSFALPCRRIAHAGVILGSISSK